MKMNLIFGPFLTVPIQTMKMGTELGSISVLEVCRTYKVIHQQFYYLHIQCSRPWQCICQTQLDEFE